MITMEEMERSFREEMRRHNEEIAALVEKAKDPTLYLDYFGKKSLFDKSLTLYGARKRGTGHVKDGMPCQDYCLTSNTRRSQVLVLSDGVSACPYGDKGAELGCIALTEQVAAVDKLSRDERDFVNKLCGLPFRTALVKRWVDKVSADIAENGKQATLLETEKYGATLSFAVITDNWIVTGNHGDGQILLFNPTDALCVRWHLPKSDTVTDALCNPTCASDGFIVEKHRRVFYSGVLLSTDGIYDKLPSARLFRAYADQITERFERTGKPHMPFCFHETKDGKERDIDISASKTHDDCTILLAVDHRPVSSFPAETVELLKKEGYKVTGISARMGHCTLYELEKDAGSYIAVVTQKTKHNRTDKGISHGTQLGADCAELAVPVQETDTKTAHISVYTGNKNYTPQKLFATGKLKDKNRKKYGANAADMALISYKLLEKTENALNSKGYYLNGTAHASAFLLDKDKLLLLPEAVSALDCGKKPHSLLWSYYKALLGVLDFGGSETPLFTCGYSSLGRVILRNDTKEEQPFCYLLQEKKDEYRMVNISGSAWITEDGISVFQGESLPLEDGLSFKTEDGTQISFRYIKH